MSRGNRDVASGNLKMSMRDNYSEHGVDEYYKKVGSTYRNPHFPGVKACLFSWYSKWWEMERATLSSHPISVFDLACGRILTHGILSKGLISSASGEATLVLMEWWSMGRRAHDQKQQTASASSSALNSAASPLGSRVVPTRIPKLRDIPSIELAIPRPIILAADPYTAEAFQARTGMTCTTLSFKNVADGQLPSPSVRILASDPLSVANAHSSDITRATDADGDGDLQESPETLVEDPTGRAKINVVQEPPSETSTSNGDSVPGVDLPVEMVICSFALHLIETPSELFALLWELSTKARWLLILAPHKKPEIKDGWGWCKWDVENWHETRMGESKGEYLHDRVHCRVYRSLNA